MNEIDEIELAASAAEVETGARGTAAKVPLCRGDGSKDALRRWPAEEDAFLRENLGRITEQEIAEQLGRSVQAVHLRWTRELHLTAPTKSAEILTAEQVAWGLGRSCGKSIHQLMDEGLMPGRRLPGMDVNRVVDRQALLLWMIEPRHWVYFKPEDVGSLRGQGKRDLADCYDFEFWDDARELVAKARAAWKDEWLTPGQVAREIGFKNPRTGAHSINKAIHVGNLPGFRWGNWWILRSSLPPSDMTINVLGRIVPKVKPKYVCPRGMAHPNLATCRKLRFCRELIK
jgi:hypothetical protein